VSGEIIELPLAQVYPGPLVRVERLDLDHVAVLADVDLLPPIIVRQTAKGYECLDGAHRCAARRSAGFDVVRAVVREADDAEALEIAYQSNKEHGLPLTLAERKAGARKLIAGTHLSDASIASIVGLARNTVAGMRPAVQPAQNDMLDGKRTGADGKARPGSKAEQEAQRDEIRKLLIEHPDLSLNEIARRAGCSPMTAAKVREAMNKIEPEGTPATPPAPPTGSVDGPSPADGDQRDGAGVEGARPSLSAVPPIPQEPDTVAEIVPNFPPPRQWVKAEGMTATNATRDFARFMDRRTLRSDEDTNAIAAACPAPARASAIACARVQAAKWTALADSLEAPARLETAR